jgi:hypothetical protein
VTGRDPLAAFQEVMLSALERGGESWTITAQLRGAAPDDAFTQWVESWEPELTDLAALLVRQWVMRR